jgi:hypothetical protein
LQSHYVSFCLLNALWCARSFAGKLAEGCTTVQGDALDYAFFEHTMANFPCE